MKYLGLLAVVFTTLFTQCKSSKEVETTEEKTVFAKQLEQKILVTLSEGTRHAELEEKFEKFSLKHKSVASRSDNRHLYTFDANTISADDLLKKLNKQKSVYLAEPLAYGVGKPQQFTSGKKKKVEVK